MNHHQGSGLEALDKPQAAASVMPPTTRNDCMGHVNAHIIPKSDFATSGGLRRIVGHLVQEVLESDAGSNVRTELFGAVGGLADLADAIEEEGA